MKLFDCESEIVAYGQQQQQQHAGTSTVFATMWRTVTGTSSVYVTGTQTV
jgi:hypothetical protein